MVDGFVFPKGLVWDGYIFVKDFEMEYPKHTKLDDGYGKKAISLEQFLLENGYIVPHSE